MKVKFEKSNFYFSAFIAVCLLAAACTSTNSLSVARSNVAIGTKSFDGKAVGLDLADQVDVIHTSMGAKKFIFENTKTTVRTFFTMSLKDKAKSVTEGKGEITLKPKLDLDIVNDYFSAGCLAKFELTMFNAKGQQVKSIQKEFKKSYFNSGFGSPERNACNQAATEVMAIALSAL